MNYAGATPSANKYLQPDGSLTTLDGTLVSPATAEGAQMYLNASAIANKMLNPDGSISTFPSGGTGGGGGDMTYPPLGVAVSTGTAWGASIPAANLARTDVANTFASAQTFGSTVTLHADPSLALQAATKQYVDGKAAGGGMVYPGAGIGVSTGTAWGTSIDPATLVKTSVANTFTADQTMGANLNAPYILSSLGAGVTNSTYQLHVVSDYYNQVMVETTSGSYYALVWYKTPVAVWQTGVNGGGNYYLWNTILNGTSFSCTPQGDGHFAGGLSCGGVKSFKIPLPVVRGGESDPAQTLTHACLEGPEAGVFYRGEVMTQNGSAEITLPEYFEALTLDEGRTVLLTQMFDEDQTEPEFALLMSSQVRGGQFTVRSSIPVAQVSWEVKAVRADVPPLAVVSATSAPIKVAPMPPESKEDAAATQAEPEPKPKRTRS